MFYVNSFHFVFLQSVQLTAEPLVQTISVSDSNTPGGNDTVFCRIPLSYGNVNLTISRDMQPQALQELLNSNSDLEDFQVEVFKDYYSSDFFMAEYSKDVKFTIVFLASPEIEENLIPKLSLRSDTEDLLCEHSNEQLNTTYNGYMIQATVETVQTRNYSSDFTVGFQLSTQAPRMTPSLPINVTTDVIESEVSDLFVWDCSNDLPDDGVFYRSSLEDSSESNRVNDTAFCGHYSEQNPGAVWRNVWFPGDEPIDVNLFRNLYVSP